MEDTKSNAAIKSDVLHSDNPTKLTPEEIAKAVAHHNRHHQKDKPDVPAKGSQGKKPGDQKRR
jgi:hypothetical protein